MKQDHSTLKTLYAAFPSTIPIMTAFLFLGLTYGVLVNVSGFPWYYATLMALTIFAGSVEFLCVHWLIMPFHPLQVFALTLMVNARHLFYGISMLDRYKGTGWRKLYLIFGLCDETFSINYTIEPPAGIDRTSFMTAVTALNQSYWVVGATAGGLFGSYLTFNMQGLGFVLTAMFVVIFLEQWLKQKNRAAAYVGFGVSLICLLAFGSEQFIIPTMLGILGVLTLLRRPLEDKLPATPGPESESGAAHSRVNVKEEGNA
ncbi:MAG: AzlC family ABC transporter permease [Succinivibrio sp.]|nr:AzlC family ABC transporter permease [Succinivibrio sp.]